MANWRKQCLLFWQHSLFSHRTFEDLYEYIFLLHEGLQAFVSIPDILLQATMHPYILGEQRKEDYPLMMVKEKYVLQYST